MSGVIKGLSCNSGLLSAFGVEEAIDILAESGYQAIDISLELAPPFLPVPVPHMRPRSGKRRRPLVRRRAERAGITIAAVNAHTSLIHGDPQVRLANWQFVNDSIRLAGDLGAGFVITGSGLKNYYGYESQYWDWFLEALREMVVTARQEGVVLLVEAGSFPGCLLRNLETMQKVIGADGLAELGVLFDPAHYHVRGDPVVEAYRTLHDRVRHVHAKDARGNPENFEFPPLGMGDIDYKSLFSAMLARDYSGFISVEYEALAWGYAHDPRKVLAEGKAFIDQITAGL